MANYRGCLNTNASDGGSYSRGSAGGYRGSGSYRGISNYGQVEDDAAGNSGPYRGGAPRGGYGQREHSSGEGFRGGHGSHSQQDENQSASGGYRGSFSRGSAAGGGFSRGGGAGGYSRGGGAEGYSRGGSAEGYSRGGSAEGYSRGGSAEGYSRGGGSAYRGGTDGRSYRGTGEGYRGGNRGRNHNLGGGSQADAVEQGGGYRRGGRGGYANQGYQDDRGSLTSVPTTSTYQPTEEGSARLDDWNSTPVTGPSPFTAFKKPNGVFSDPPVEPALELNLQQQSLLDEPVIETIAVMQGKDKTDVSEVSPSDKLNDLEVTENAADVVRLPGLHETTSRAEIDEGLLAEGKEAMKPTELLNSAADPVADPPQGVPSQVPNFVPPPGPQTESSLIPEVERSPISSPAKPGACVNTHEGDVGAPGASSGFKFTQDDFRKLAEISGLFKVAFSELQELATKML